MKWGKGRQTVERVMPELKLGCLSKIECSMRFHLNVYRGVFMLTVL